MDNFLSIKDCPVEQLNELLKLSVDLKRFYESRQTGSLFAGKDPGFAF